MRMIKQKYKHFINLLKYSDSELFEIVLGVVIAAETFNSTAAQIMLPKTPHWLLNLGVAFCVLQVVSAIALDLNKRILSTTAVSIILFTGILQLIAIDINCWDWTVHVGLILQFLVNVWFSLKNTSEYYGTKQYK